jgi:hypothetical protein
LSAKLPDISRPQFPLSLLEVSRVGGDVGALGGGSRDFQSRVRTISLHGCGTYGGISLQGSTFEGHGWRGGGGAEEFERDWERPDP